MNNIISPSVIGTCPLSLPAVELGIASTVTIDGTISAGGVCGFGVSAGDRSRIENNGAIFTAGIVGIGLVTGNSVTVQSRGLIATTGASASGIFSGDELRMATESTSRITTSGIGAHGIAAGANATITQYGLISTAADVASGIDVSANATITNHGTIETHANNAFGIHTGNYGNVTNTGTILSLLDRPAFPAMPTAGVFMEGAVATLLNTASGTIAASHTAVRFDVTTGATLVNAGNITATPALRFDGTTAPAGGAVVFSGGGSLENSGIITSHENAPAIQANGPLRLTNRGRINGDVILGNGDDTVILQSGSSFIGTLDAGEGDNALFLIGQGVLDHDVKNVDTLTKSGAGTWRLARNLMLTGQANIIDGTLELGSAAHLQATTIGNLGTLRGSGETIGTFENTGRVAPGSETTFGRLSFQHYRQLANGVLAIRLSPNGNSDSIAVSDTADLQGTLTLSYVLTQEAPTFAGGETFDIIIPTNGQLATTGTFKLDAPALTFLRPHLTSSENGGLVLEIERLSYASAGQTAAQKSVGRLFDRLRLAQRDDLAETFTRLEYEDASFASQLLSTTAGDGPGAAQTLSFLTLEQAAATFRAQQPTTVESGTRSWAALFHRTGTTRNTPSSRYRTAGLAAGLTVGTDATRFGLAVARVDGHASHDDARAQTALDTALVALTAHHDATAFYVNGMLMYGTARSNMQRTRTLEENFQTLSADSHSRLWLTNLEVGHPYITSRLVVTPHLGVTYMHTKLDPIDEKEPLSIRTETSRDDSLRLQTGVKAQASFGMWRPYGALALSTEFLQTEAQIPAHLNGISESQFQLSGDSRRRINLTAAVGIAVLLARGLEVSVAADIAANDLLAGRSLNAVLSYRW